MSKQEFDVVVIGAGMAGLTSAKKIAERGLKVSVVCRGVGATNMSSGVVDILGYVPESKGDRLFLNPEEGIRELVAKNPKHPYGIVGGGTEVGDEERGNRALKILKEASKSFKEESRKQKIEYFGETTRNILVTNLFGTFKPTCLAPSTMYPGDLTRLRNSRILFVGVRGYADFNPTYISETILRLSQTSQKEWGVELSSTKPAYLDLPGLEGRRNILSIEVARAMDDEEVLKEVSKRLKKLVNENKPTHIALPTLGITTPEKNLGVIEKETETKVFEIPSFPPSVAGARLQALLETAALKSGVNLAKGYEALRADVRNGVCEGIWVRPTTGYKEFLYLAKAFVLATGDIIGGGLVSEDRVIKEPIFNLPISPIGEARPENFTTWTLDEPFPSKGHPVSRLGIEANNNLNPQKNGKTLVKNLYVAGSILAGFDYNVEKSGLGVCLATGYLAGEFAAKGVKKEE